jgi:hypothetical protein
MRSELDLFTANGAELSRQARRKNVARLAAPVARIWAGTVGHLTRTSREAHQRKELLDRLETMPPYMLKDIGVARDQLGRFCHTNAYGMSVELVPAVPARSAPRSTAGVDGGLAYAAG